MWRHLKKLRSHLKICAVTSVHGLYYAYHLYNYNYSHYLSNLGDLDSYIHPQHRIIHSFLRLAVTTALMGCADLWSSPKGGINLVISKDCDYFCFPDDYTHYTKRIHFCWGSRCLWDIGTARISQTQRPNSGQFALYNCLVLGHTKYKGVQRVYCNPFPANPFYGSHRLDLVMIRPPGIDNGAFVVSPDTACLLGYCSYSQLLLQQTLNPWPSIVPSYQPWKPTMILEMVVKCIKPVIIIIRIIVIVYIIAIYQLYS